MYTLVYSLIRFCNYCGTVVFNKRGCVVVYVDEAVHTIAIPNMYMDMHIALLVYIVKEVVTFPLSNKHRFPSDVVVVAVFEI